MPETSSTTYLTTFWWKLEKMGFLGKIIDIERRTLKKVSKNAGLLSKLRCFLMIPDEPRKCLNLLNKPTFFETFLKFLCSISINYLA